jgi:hypothetical protein
MSIRLYETTIKVFVQPVSVFKLSNEQIIYAETLAAQRLHAQGE